MSNRIKRIDRVLILPRFGAFARTFRPVLKAINRVHRDGALPRIPVSPMDAFFLGARCGPVRVVPTRVCKYNAALPCGLRPPRSVVAADRIEGAAVPSRNGWDAVSQRP